MSLKIIHDDDGPKVLFEKLTEWGGRAPKHHEDFSSLTGNDVKSWTLEIWKYYELVVGKYPSFQQAHGRQLQASPGETLSPLTSYQRTARGERVVFPFFECLALSGNVVAALALYHPYRRLRRSSRLRNPCL